MAIQGYKFTAGAAKNYYIVAQIPAERARMIMCNKDFNIMEVQMLEDLETMQPAEIEELRIQWLTEHTAELEKHTRVIDYINAICNLAISRVEKKMELTQ